MKTKHILALLLPILFLINYHLHQQNNLPKNFENTPLILKGTIDSIPQNSHCYHSFHFYIKNTTNNKITTPVHQIIQLSWYACNLPKKLTVGDEWQFLAKLKSQHPLNNPGGYDYSAWLFVHNLHAKGYIHRNSPLNQFIASHLYSHPIDRIRQYLYHQLINHIKDPTLANLIAAITIGVKQNISPHTWILFRKTGTLHLMAISGLHIGLITGLIFFVSRRLGRWIAIEYSAIIAIIAAFFYALLAGFSMPTQRAFIMVLFAMISLIYRRQLNFWRIWSVALLFCFLIHPLSILLPNFWLSFSAVALLVYGFQESYRSKLHFSDMHRSQWIMLVGAMPLLIWFFHQAPAASPLANCIAIPWVSIMVLPFALLGFFGMILHIPGADFLLQISAITLHMLLIFLQFLVTHIHKSFFATLTPWQFVAAMIGSLLMLTPKGFPARHLGWIPLLPLLIPHHIPMPKNHFQLTVLDVGQGLSTVVQTQNHWLVYDTGIKYTNGFSMGDAVLVPYLEYSGAHRIDTLLVSHQDNDHSGGVEALYENYPVNRFLTSKPDYFQTNAQYCLRGQHWEWDGVNFDVLYPDVQHLHLDNNSSCVLKISNTHQSVLFVGDIEKSAEKWLVNHAGAELASSVLIVPHHGSKSSSSEKFIQTVNPQYAIFSYGYRNRYHFPNKKVIERYQSHHINMLNTSDTGAITIDFSEKIQVK
ncbi:MAG: DNA internalization-related competence protein ComEC/Rec2 [Gammaproteobacteria bacterium]